MLQHWERERGRGRACSHCFSCSAGCHFTRSLIPAHCSLCLLYIKLCSVYRKPPGCSFKLPPIKINCSRKNCALTSYVVVVGWEPARYSAGIELGLVYIVVTLLLYIPSLLYLARWRQKLSLTWACSSSTLIWEEKRTSLSTTVVLWHRISLRGGDTVLNYSSLYLCCQ